MSYVYKTRGELLMAAADAPQRRDDRAEYVRDAIAAGIQAAHVAPVFRRGFDRYVCMGDTIECEHGDFTIVARIEHDSDTRIDDTGCFDVNRASGTYSDGPQGDAEYARAMEVRRAWEADEWHYCGVVLSVAYRGVTLDEHAASLWGIECNYPGGDGNSYLTIVAHELLGEALDIGHAKLATLKE